MCVCVAVPFARPDVLHLEEHVIFYRTAVGSAHTCGLHPQLCFQRPHLVQHRGEELMNILQMYIHKHTEKFKHIGETRKW